MDLRTVQARAAHVLKRHLGCDAALSDPVLLKDATRSFVLRCAVEARGAVDGVRSSAPSSVIVKSIRDDPALGFSEWASLALLSGLPGTEGLAPRFLGGDVGERLFLMEDLGGSTSLDDLLRGRDPKHVGAALRGMAVAMGRLCAHTLGCEERYGALRRRLPASEGLGRQAEAARWLDGVGRCFTWFRALGFEPPPGLAACAEEVARIYADPGPFLAFSHGDPAPTNNHIRGGAVRLLDFEYGGFRHALYDLAAWNVLCPLPAAWVEEMSRLFRRELAGALPAVQDDAAYKKAWAAMCAFRGLAILSWIGPDVLEANRPWVDDGWTSRHAVLAAVGRLAQATAGVQGFESLHTAAAGLKEQLERRWPEYGSAERLVPPWPAI